jgi:hypothetical protein
MTDAPWSSSSTPPGEDDQIAAVVAAFPVKVAVAGDEAQRRLVGLLVDLAGREVALGV